MSIIPLVVDDYIMVAEFVKKYRILFYLPLIISAPLLYTSQWTHLFYWFDENNLYIAAAV